MVIISVVRCPLSLYLWVSTIFDKVEAGFSS
jgi:hypothetical protein